MAPAQSRAMSGLDPGQQRLQQEFNEWQARGKGPSMARHHQAITERAIAAMGLKAGDRVLDLGCGSGWAARQMAKLVGKAGLAAGADISDAMIGEADAARGKMTQLEFRCAPAEHLPWPDGNFTHVLSVESFYYYADQRVVLDELQRLVRPGGHIYLLMCLYTGNPNAERWQQSLRVPVHLRSADEYRTLLTEAGWQEAAVEEFEPDAREENPDEHAWACLAMGRRS